MNVFVNMKVGTKITLLISVLLLGIVSVAAIGTYQLKKVSDESDLLYEKNLLAVSYVKEANIDLLYASRAIRNMAIAQDAELRAGYAKTYTLSIAQLNSELEKTRACIHSPDALEVFSKVKINLEKLIPEQQAFINNINTFSPQDILGELLKERATANVVDSAMSELNGIMEKAAEARAQLTTDIYEHGLLLSAVCLGLALLFGGCIGYATKRSIAAPLVEVASKASKVAGGDLDQHFNMVREDEIGQLAAALEAMVENLRLRIAEATQKSLEAESQSQKAGVAAAEAQEAKGKAEAGHAALLTAAEEVEQVVNRLSAATEQLSAQVEESSRGMDMQRDRVANSATAMEEMNSTVLEVARNAGVASEGSERARGKAQNGQGIVANSVQSIGVVQKDTHELKNNMESLGRQAESIGTILTVISDIADQTNLLALNAAIEAARAGDAGRGFAVVADEVRKLAEKTMTATKEVGEAIGGIQAGTRQSISTVERTTANLDAATELVKQSGDALAEIVNESVATADQVRNIATAAEEQSAASEEITHSLDEINRMTDETATAMQQSAQAVSELAQQSQALQHLVCQLRA